MDTAGRQPLIPESKDVPVHIVREKIAPKNKDASASFFLVLFLEIHIKSESNFMKKGEKLNSGNK